VDGELDVNSGIDGQGDAMHHNAIVPGDEDEAGDFSSVSSYIVGAGGLLLVVAVVAGVYAYFKHQQKKKALHIEVSGYGNRASVAGMQSPEIEVDDGHSNHTTLQGNPLAAQANGTDFPFAQNAFSNGDSFAFCI